MRLDKYTQKALCRYPARRAGPSNLATPPWIRSTAVGVAQQEGGVACGAQPDRG
ncbi:MAG: hypothetical protein R2932_08535 [Caldilineaceae bacterium]